jgi:hypothetical protein
MMIVVGSYLAGRPYMDTWRQPNEIRACRVSTTGQSLEVQLAQLESAGCDRIKSEKASGKTAARAELQGLLQHVPGPGDTLVVCKLDRLSRSTSDLFKIAEEMDKQGASLEVLNINLDSVLHYSELVEYQATHWY